MSLVVSAVFFSEDRPGYAQLMNARVRLSLLVLLLLVHLAALSSERESGQCSVRFRSERAREKLDLLSLLIQAKNRVVAPIQRQWLSLK